MSGGLTMAAIVRMVLIMSTHLDTITTDEHARLTRLVDARGERRAAEHLGIDRGTLLRLLLCRPVRRGTVALVRIALEDTASAA